MTTATSFVNDINNALDILNRKYTIQGNLKNLKIVAREFRPYGFTYLRFEEVLNYLSKHGFLKLKYTYTDHMMQIGAWGQVEIDEGTYDLGVEHEKQSYVILDLSDDFLKKYENYSDGHSIIVKPVNSRTISSLEIVDPGSAMGYLVVVNEKYDKPIRVSAKPNGSWDILLRLARGEKISVNAKTTATKSLLNSNSNCKLYTQGGYQKTAILVEEDGFLKVAIPLKIITHKTYMTKFNKVKPT